MPKCVRYALACRSCPVSNSLTTDKLKHVGHIYQSTQSEHKCLTNVFLTALSQFRNSQASVQLKQLVSNIGMTIPAEITDEQKTDRDRLAKLTGDEFDREYMQMMVTGHDRAIAAFEEESREGSVPDVKSWATKMLPTLKEHQALAKEIAAKLG